MQDTPVSDTSRKKTTWKIEPTASDPELCKVQRQHTQISRAQKAACTKEIIDTEQRITQVALTESSLSNGQ